MKFSYLIQALTPDHSQKPFGDDGASPQIVFPDSVSGSAVSNPDPEIRSLHYRAQDVKPGGLFVAIIGQKFDGHDYIDLAVQKGAIAVVVQKAVASNAIIFNVPNTRQALAQLAEQFYGNPSQKMKIIGVTGTNGKTTTTYLIESILLQAGHRVGVIGTINYRFGSQTYANPTTTPESADLSKILAQMHHYGVTHVIMEVSSHAIAMHRVGACHFDIGVFTNLTQDHLDFHGSMEAYWDCKRAMFTHLMARGNKARKAIAVINCDNVHGRKLRRRLSYKTLSFGCARSQEMTPRDIQAHALQINLKGVRADIHTPLGTIEIASVLVGRHNIENILAAVGVGVALEIPPLKQKEGVERIKNIPGRLEAVPNPHRRFVFVDYAHTPDALKNVLTALNQLKQRRLISVFGCGGDRDKEKRPQMGAIAYHYSDLAIITSDNPRSESQYEITAQIRAGIQTGDGCEYPTPEEALTLHEKGFMIEEDRDRAIHIAVNASAPGDTILIAGKGHETYQVIGDQITPFDDRKRARAALAGLNAQQRNNTNCDN